MPETADKDSRIIKLEQSYSKWIQLRDVQRFDKLVEDYWQLLSTINQTQSTVFHATLIEYFPKVFLACAEIGEELQLNIWNKATDFLLRPNILPAVLADKDGERAMAWFCCEHSVAYYYDFTKGYEGNFCKLIELWTGHPMQDKENPTLDNVITTIYGEHVWSLYGGDVNDIGKALELVNTLTQINPPFAFKEKSLATSPIADLPEDFSHD